MGSSFGKLRKGLGSLLQTQQLKAELNAVLERRREAILKLGEGTFRLIENGFMQPTPADKDAYLDARALDERARELKKLIAEGYAGTVPAPSPARSLPDLLDDSGLEARPASLEEGPLGPPEVQVPPPEVRAKLGACICGALIPAGAKYCPQCGMPAPAVAGEPKVTIAPPRKCPNCGAQVPTGADFCPHCGGHVDQEVYEV